jgi:hypothetical protein
VSHHDKNETTSQVSERGLKEADDELDTEGQAFKWVLEDDKGKQRLRQTYEPDEPKPEPRKSPDANSQQNPPRR